MPCSIFSNASAAELRREVRRIPELPARHVGARLLVARQQPGFRLLRRQVLHDGPRLGEHEVAVHQRGDGAVRVERQVVGALVLTLREVELLLVELDSQDGGSESNATDVGRQRIVVELHDGPPRVATASSRRLPTSTVPLDAEPSQTPKALSASARSARLVSGSTDTENVSVAPAWESPMSLPSLVLVDERQPSRLRHARENGTEHRREAAHLVDESAEVAVRRGDVEHEALVAGRAAQVSDGVVAVRGPPARGSRRGSRHDRDR